MPNAVQTMIGPANAFHVYNNGGSCDILVDVVGTFYRYPPSAPTAAAAREKVTPTAATLNRINRA